MTNFRDDVLQILEDEDGDSAAAAELIYDSRRSLAIYVLTVGIDTVKANHRRDRRRELKTIIKPEFQPGPVAGSRVFTQETLRAIAKHADALFGSRGWAIGGVMLSDFTREQMLERADIERKSARGSLRNADFYEALAAPLQPGERVGAFWTEHAASALRDSMDNGAEGPQPAIE